jgi:alanine racemase
VEGVYSHFSTAEEKDVEYRNWQLKRFKAVVKRLKKFIPNVEYFHMANSAAILTCPGAHFNMVRPGISLYGVTPLGEPHDDLRPVMKMKAPVIFIKEFNKGESVGYNQQYKTDQNETIAIVQAGYADGIPTELSNKGEVEIGGTVYPIVGKISMDLVAISCRNMKLKIDQEAIFWGSDNMNFRLENLAGKYKKIPYEFLTGITKRVKRNYLHE